MDIEKLLHPRLIETCLPLIEQGHYDDAARKAMIQVELALKDKCLVSGEKKKKMYGRQLIKETFLKKALGEGESILRVPLADDLQEPAGYFFDACFEYYRNYAAHDGRNFNQEKTFRLLIIASELLDLIGSSTRSFIGIGGVEGLVKARLFKSPEQLKSLLQYIEGQIIVDNVVDGFYEDMYRRNFDNEQLDIVMEFGLVEGESSIGYEDGEAIDLFSFKLTDLGRAVIQGELILDPATEERSRLPLPRGEKR